MVEGEPGRCTPKGMLSGIGVVGCLRGFAFGVGKIQMAPSLLAFRFWWEWDPDHQLTK